MSDTQAAMREFRFLDDTRKGGGLSAVDEQRWIDLGGQLGMSAQQGYYADDGLWYAYPPGYDPNTGQYYGQQQPPQQYYDPNAYAQDPNAYAQDPNAYAQDPNAYPQDPNAYPQDPNAYPQDPNAYAQDPNPQQYSPQPDPYAPAAPWNQPAQPQHYSPQPPAYAPAAPWPQPAQPQHYSPQPAPYVPAAQWSQPEHPQQQAQWPQNYDPNTGQYFEPPRPPEPQQWQAPTPVVAAQEDDGPIEIAEDEVMEVTDDDVTLLDPSPQLTTPTQAEPAPYRPFVVERPLTSSAPLSIEPESIEVEPLLEAILEPEPAVTAPEIPVFADSIPEPIVTAPEPAVTVPDLPVPAEMPSIMVAEDLGAQTFEAKPLVLTKVAPSSATQDDLYPAGVPAPVAPPELPTAPVSFDLEPVSESPSDDIPDPRPSIPISIQVEEPVEDGSFGAEPILESSVELGPEPVTARAFSASFDDLPMAVEPELPVSTHTGFEASLGDLPPAIANEPPPPIVDVELLPSVPMVDFDIAVDDKPVPVETHMELGAEPEDTGSFSIDGQSLVENEPLATLANPAAPTGAYEPIELPPEEPDAGVPLASNADFLGMLELNNTGEAWTRRDTSVSLSEEPAVEAEIAEEPDDVIQGIELEDDLIEAEISAELEEEDVIAPAPWSPPVRSMPPPPPPDSASPPGPIPFVPKPPPQPAAFIPLPPVRASAVPFAPVRGGGDSFETEGSAPREDASAPVIFGEHRVILHTIEGQVKRGVLRDTELDAATVGLEATPGTVEQIPRPRIKAIFFMLPAGQKAPAPKGDKLRVTFRDGRQLAGFSSDHRGSGIGFFVVPADNRTNTERIFIYRSSVEKVAVD